MNSATLARGRRIAPRYGLPWLAAGLVVALHYHLYHRVEWDWALWWGVKDGLLWGALAAAMWWSIDRFFPDESLHRRSVLAILVVAAALGALAHSVSVVSLSYLVEGFSTDRPFASVVGHQLLKKAPLNLSIFLAITGGLLVARHLKRTGGEQQAVGPADAASHTRRLLIHGPRGEVLLKIDDIDRIEAEGNYVAIHAGEQCFLERRTMAETARELGAAGFARIHRSHLIRLDRLKRIERTPGGGHKAVLDDGTRVPMSRAFRRRLKDETHPSGS